jgi:hypothetical protein
VVRAGRLTPLWLLLGCGSPEVTVTPVPSAPTGSASLQVTADTGAAPTSGSTTSPIPGVWADDLATATGYDDLFFGHYQRGRAAVVADFDGDGDFDVFSGNPGDTSYLLMNRLEEGALRFEPGQELGKGLVMWGGAAADADGDGDPDLYVTIGGNERGGEGLDLFFRNDDGVLVDRSRAAGVWARDAQGEVVLGHHASAFFFDLDNDGHLDLFTNHHVTPGSLVGQLAPGDALGINGVLHNDGVGSFTDIAFRLGFDHQWSTRSSTALDIDGDGDLDLYENNWIGPNLLWRNDSADGVPAFTDVTEAWSVGGSLRFPGFRSSQAAIPADLNQDGFDDLVVFRYAAGRDRDEPASHSEGHLVWINLGGQGFVEVADHTGVNDSFLREERSHNVDVGVMGCQMGDLNADGIADLFMGFGSPYDAAVNELMVSTGLKTVVVDGVGEVVVPTYARWSALIDTESPGRVERHDEGVHYPYRSHGAAFADFDGDGLYELAVHNGGPAWLDPEVAREPNRLFRFRFDTPPHHLRVELVGDGDEVARDAIGARVRATVRDPDGSTREVFATRRSATGFGAQNDPDVFLGLGSAEQVEQLVVRWPGGREQVVAGPFAVDQRLTVVWAP